MRLRDDDRAQSIQVGAVLLFAVLIIAFSSYQAFVVPNQNRAVEFNHNQQVRDQMQDLRNEVVSIHGETATRSVTLTLGTRYPGRLAAVNPGPPSGTIRTIGTRPDSVNLTVAHAEAAGESGDFWTGVENRTYNTGGVVYQPNYNVYGSAPLTVYENTVLYNQFRDSNLTASGQTLIDDETISLVTVNGSISQTRTGSTSLDLRPVSTSTTTVPVTNASATENVTITTATQLPKSRWDALLDTQLNENGGHVVDYDIEPIDGSSFDMLWIELEPSVTYRLRMTKVGVGTGVADAGSAYLTDVAGNGTRLDVDDTTTVTLELRDAYNNPITDAQVNASTQTGSMRPQQALTGNEGEVSFTYDSTGVTGDQWVDLDFSIVTDPGATFDSTTTDNVTMQVYVRSPPASNGGGGGVYTTAWDRPPYSSSRITSGELLAGADRGLPLRMQATDGGSTVANAEVDYAVNDSAVATYSNDTGRTDASGYNVTDLVWQGDGYLRAYATTDATGDRFNATIDQILDESFEDPAETLSSNGWTYNDSGDSGNGGGGVRAIGGDADDGTRAAYINGSGSTGGDRAVEQDYSLNTSEYDGLTITYVAIETASPDDPDIPGFGSYDSNENLKLQYHASDGSWVTVDNVSSQVDSGLPASYVRRATIENVANASHSNFALRFRQGQTTATDEWKIDSVALVGLAVENRVADLNQDPVAEFTYSPASPTTADTVTFDAANADDPDGSVTAYEWDFTDDGTYEATGRTATHSYATSGSDTAVLRVTDDSGETNTTTRVVAVSGVSNDPSAIQFSNFQGFAADSVANEFTLNQIQVQDSDGDNDLDRIEYEVTDSNGNVVATQTVNNIGPAQYQPSGTPAVTLTGSSVQEGETYTLTGTAYDSDGNFDSQSLSDTTNTYNIVSVNTRSAGGNSINVTFEINTDDPGAEVFVESFDNQQRGSSGQVQVTASQPQTEIINGANQANQVRVILYDGDGVEVERQTVSYP
jgi:hypothetical protein